tara:strand:- start:127 stop:660 length:534 start_codon:yes stop_codon:yes gene_type:complete
MDQPLEDVVLSIICADLAETFYLEELVYCVRKNNLSHLSYDSTKRLVIKVLDMFERQPEPIIQTMGMNHTNKLMYRKLYEEDADGYLIKKLPILPSFFEAEHLRETRNNILKKVSVLEERISAYQRLTETFPTAGDWSGEKLNVLEKKITPLYEDLSVIDQLLCELDSVLNVESEKV